MNHGLIFAAGMAATLAAGALWHGPLGAGERLATRSDKIARATLDYYELPAVNARLEREPLRRRIVLSGPADAFQRSELLRIMAQVPGVNEVRWDPASLPQESRP
jgi:hypothetical protein